MRLGRGSFSSQRHGIRYFAFFTETKWQTFRGIPGFYSTSGAVDYKAVILCAHLVAVKCEVFTTTSTREIQLCTRPATQLTCCPYFRQISHARPLRMRENLSERGLLNKKPVVILYPLWLWWWHPSPSVQKVGSQSLVLVINCNGGKNTNDQQC